MTVPYLRQKATLFEPRPLLRWEYVGRLAISGAIFLAAVFGWRDAPRESTLIAALIMLGSLLITVGSAAWSEVYRRPLTNGFMGVQILVDLALVTAIVHVTGGANSQFAALYILVIAVAALLLSASAGLLVAALGCILYFGDVLLAQDSATGLALGLQLGVFAGVALSAAFIASRLREARAGHEELAAELVKVRLQADDILKNIRSGIVTIDAEGTLLYANPAASSLLGLDFSRSVGAAVLDRIEGVSPTLALALERAAKKGVRTTRAEGRVSSGARHFPIGLNTTVTNSHASANGDDPLAKTEAGTQTATAIFQDISDQKRLDTLHMRTQRLEAVAELSASLAHEIKNPLASIRSAVEQIGHSKHATPDEQTLTELIVRESDRLSRLLSEFLDFSRVRMSRIEQLEVGTVVRGAANLAGAHPGRPEGVTVACDIPEAPIGIEGDEDLLHRAIFNLVLNAVQASPPGGVVRVDVSAVRGEDAPAGVALERGGAMVRVSDSGPGIPADVRDRLFDPFFTTKPGGSGLGLAIVHRAIESHRGFVFVDSDERGTRVSVLLPREHADPGESR